MDDLYAQIAAGDFVDAVRRDQGPGVRGRLSLSVTTTALEGVGAAAPTPAVDLASITKHYGRVVACDDVDLHLHAGRIHGILGENGAGKSTLMKILIGLVQPDRGTITLAGRET